MSLTIGFVACNADSGVEQEIAQLKEQTIGVHDDIMPQISDFDRKVIKIDELLGRMDSLKQNQVDLDTAALTSQLKHIKGRLEGATDAMNRWMMEFNVDSISDNKQDVKSYYQKELDRIQKMKETFEEVTKESTEELARFL